MSTPRQRQIMAELLGDKSTRPEFDPELAPRLRARLEQDLAAVAAEHRKGDPLVVSKYELQNVHACEAFYDAKRYERFAWSLGNVRGRVVHRALQRQIVSGYKYEPLDLVEEVVVAFAEEDDEYGPAEFLRGLTAGEREDLVADAGDVLTKFLLDWPRIQRSWKPRVESAMAHSLCDGRVELRGRVDLAIGAPEGNRAGVFVVDFKTGRENDHHIQDARFYALVETLRSETPPFRVATYYVDSGSYRSEDVTEDVLEVAVRRTVDGARAMHRIDTGGAPPPERRPNPLCRFCPALDGCEPGTRHVESGRRRGEPDDDLEPLP